MVATEAKKGYDFLVVGIEPTAARGGGFNAEVARVAGAFEGPFAIVAARAEHVEDPQGAPLSILVAVNGTEVSRRGAEVALAMARAAHAPVTALFVSNAGARSRRRRISTLPSNDQAVLKDIATLAEQFDVPIRTAVRVNIAAEDAILRQARLGRHSLVVMGVARRPGETLAFGNVAEAVLEASERSVVFVAS
jgi:nucleotide-binding universal stress UspA family protein